MSQSKPGPRLGRWIFLRFVLLLLVIVAPLVTLVFVTTESGFRGYVYHGDVSKAHAFAPILEKRYLAVGSWPAVKPLLDDAPFSYHAVSSHERGSSVHSADPNLDFDWIQERVVILDTTRRVVVDSKHLLEGSLHPAGHLMEAVVLQGAGGQTIGYLLVGTMVDPALTQNHEVFLGTLVTTLLVLFTVSLALSVPLAFWLGSRVARPLRLLVEGTRRAAAGDWRWSAPAGAPREVVELYTAFQSLGAHLRAAEDRKARLLADAAHELRTPLTVVRGTVEAMLDGVFPLEPTMLQAVYAEALRLEKIVDSLRLLEDLHRRPFAAVEFDWAPFLHQVVALFRAQAQERGQILDLVCPAGLQGWGEPEALTQILVNLISNALRHAPDSGRVRVEVAPETRGQVLSIDDNGPGIPEADRELVFERFVRLDPSRSGQTGGRGLGLSIVRELSERHGGTVRVVAGAWGGARFEVLLPGGPGATTPEK